MNPAPIDLIQDLIESRRVFSKKIEDFIIKEITNFANTEELEMLGAYHRTTESLLDFFMGYYQGECYKPNIETLTARQIIEKHQDPVLLLNSLRMLLNLQSGVEASVAYADFEKNMNRLGRKKQQLCTEQ